MARITLFSDEATFSLNGTESTQNERVIWNYKKVIDFFRESFNADRYLSFLKNIINDFLDKLLILERQYT